MSDEGLLSRWSRRKLQDPALREAEDRRQQAVEQVPGSALDTQPIEDSAPPLTDADMPDVESLGEDSDYSLFMSPGVSDELRNLALRKLFRAPMFNQRDGLDEYDDDYTSFEKLGDIVTADMKHQLEMEALKKQEQQDMPSTVEQMESDNPPEDDHPALCAEEPGSELVEINTDDPALNPDQSQSLTQSQTDTHEHDQDEYPRA